MTRMIGQKSRFLALALAVALLASLLPATEAQAYYNFGTVSVATGASSLTVTAGSSVSTSVTVTPSSDDQTLGCGMAKCPQVCTDDDVVAEGYTCFDVNGQCTCAGSSYSTYYAETTVSSSNSAVATATISGGTLTITGVSAGTATITVGASLRQWTDGSTTVTVTVVASETSDDAADEAEETDSSTSSSSDSALPAEAVVETEDAAEEDDTEEAADDDAQSEEASEDADDASSSDGSDSDDEATESSDDDASEDETDDTSSSSSDASSSADVAEEVSGLLAEAVTTDSDDSELNVSVVETVAGTVYTVEINDYLVTSEQLLNLVEDDDQLILWSGASSESPTYSWTFTGDSVDVESAFLDFDPTITISKLGTGNVANIMAQSSGGLVMEFTHDGELPGTATIYVATSGTFSNGTVVSLYYYNEETGCFECSDQTDIVVTDGYASFQIDHCSIWALSDDDLTAYTVEETNTPGAAASAVQVSYESEDGGLFGSIDLALVLVVVAAAVVVIAVVVAIVAGNRRRAAAARRSRAGAHARRDGR